MTELTELRAREIIGKCSSCSNVKYPDLSPCSRGDCLIAVFFLAGLESERKRAGKLMKLLKDADVHVPYGYVLLKKQIKSAIAEYEGDGK